MKLLLNRSEARTVIEQNQAYAPTFQMLRKLRALEGIKTFDLHFGTDHAETLMYDYVTEHVFDEIEALKWFIDSNIRAIPA